MKLRFPDRLVNNTPVEKQASPETSQSAPVSPGASNQPEGYSSSWIKPQGVEGTVREWARELVESAPLRTELDFAQHMENNLEVLIKRLNGDKK